MATWTKPSAPLLVDVQQQLGACFKRSGVVDSEASRPGAYFAFPHQERVVELVSERVERLQAGTLAPGQNGVAILGARGCGTSATLEALGHAVEAVRPDIMFAYVDARYVRAGEHPLRGVLAHVEIALGVEASGPELAHDLVYEQLIRVLDAHDQKVVIALDNIDFYYGTQLRTAEHKRRAAQSLDDIAAVASPHMPNTLTLLAGSSGLLQRLLQAPSDSPKLDAAYPLLQFRTSLSRSKFQVHVPQTRAIDAHLVQVMEAAIRHTWPEYKSPFSGDYVRAATAAVFWRTLAKGACLLVGSHAGGVTQLVCSMVREVEPIPSDASPEAAEAAAIRLLHVAYRDVPDVGVSGNLADSLYIDRGFSGVRELHDEFNFAWASKNQLRYCPDKLQQLTCLVQGFDDGNLQPLTQAEFEVLHQQVWSYGTRAERKHLGGDAADCIRFMVHHHLLVEDESGGLWPARAFDATVAPRGVVDTWFNKLCGTVHPTLDLRHARFEAFTKLTYGGCAAGVMGLMLACIHK